MRIEGVSEVMRYFSQAPEEVSKSIKKALRAACSGEVRNLKGQVPRWARGLVKSSVKSLRSGDVSALFGMFVDSKWQDEKGRKGPDWFHAYWKNYGTLTKRDPSHQFDNAVRRNARRRNNVGQGHENFFERGITGYEQRVLTAFKRSMKEQGYDIE